MSEALSRGGWTVRKSRAMLPRFARGLAQEK
jgi:hypothetical protein